MSFVTLEHRGPVGLITMNRPEALNALNDQVLYNALVSYPVGPLVVDLVGLLAVAYALVLVVCAPLAARAFRRHQVM